MIDEIQVQNLALIRDASLAPCAGLTVITGETGAGKTALLSALKLLMGVRASADMVRDGESALSVSGRFFFERSARQDALDVDGAAPEELAESEAPAESTELEEPAEPEELVVTRRVGADGRSRANANGSMVSMAELAQLVAPSIDLCGQFEHQQLMRPAAHVRMLDAWAVGETAAANRKGASSRRSAADAATKRAEAPADDALPAGGVAAARAAYEDAFTAAAEAAAELARVRDAGQTTSARLDEARFTLRRIDEVDPQEGEFEQLSHDLAVAEHAESLATAAATAHEALSGEEGALDALNAAAVALEAGGRVDAELAALAQSLREVGYVLEDVSASARDYRDGIEFDPEVLAAQQERYSQMKGLLRTYGPTMEDVFAARDEAAEVVSLVDDSAARLAAAELAAARAEESLAQAADALDAARAEAAPRFAAEVTAVMARLEMGGAELVCDQRRLDRSQWTKAGPSQVEFLYRPGSGMQARPLARIASGGEVSRVMLAVKVVFGAQDDVDTLVFDEVDAGVGGAVAVALAEVIADLARTHQVIVVTHLAQVAVRGDAHYVVQRRVGKGSDLDAGDQEAIGGSSGADGQGNADLKKSAGAEEGTAPETLLFSVEGEARVREIARMLSGDATETALAHARELLGNR